jgi:hypothetical protein
VKLRKASLDWQHPQYHDTYKTFTGFHLIFSMILKYYFRLSLKSVLL